VIRNEDGNAIDKKNDAILTHTENVGIGGVCIVLKKDVRMFSSVDLEVDLLDLGDHICCKGKVVWNVQRQRGSEEKPLFFDVGVEFVDINPQDQTRLSKIVERLVKNHS